MLHHTAATTELLCFKYTCSGEKVAASTERQCCVEVEGRFFTLGRMPKLVRRAKVSVTVIIVLCARFLLHVRRT